jgi:aminoglycoside phosphotransferase (APT) family kinase protein
LTVDGHPVTFWRLIEDAGRPATYGELGAVLRDLHSLAPPDDLGLPAFDAFGRADRRIEVAEGISDDDREFLRKRRRELADRFAGLAFDSGKGPVHGDAHTDNLMVDRHGRLHLIDLENFYFDRPEWDLVVSAHEYDRLGWVSQQEYAAFVDGYGRDLRDWPGFGLLAAIQEFKMTTWLMQNIAEGPHLAEEARAARKHVRGPNRRSGFVDGQAVNLPAPTAHPVRLRSSTRFPERLLGCGARAGPFA